MIPDKSEKNPDQSSAHKVLLYGEEIVKIGKVYPEIFSWICQFCRVIPKVHK